MKRWLVVVLLSASAFGQSVPATRPGFTVGKETTVVEGPLKPDGTIDYMQVVNKLLAGDVKNEENGAIPLLLLEAGSMGDGKVAPHTQQMLDALHVAIPGKLNDTQFFSEFAARRKGLNPLSEEAIAFAELEDRLIFKPWRAEDQPLAAEWVMASVESFKLAEEAAQRPKFFMPFVTPPGKSATGLEGAAIDALPLPSVLFPMRLFLTRAQMRAGGGDIAGALADVRTARNLARLADQEHLALVHLMSLATEFYAMRACAGVAVSGKLTRDQLAAVRVEINGLPKIAGEDPVRGQVEEMIALDLAMQCIKGKSLEVMRLMSLDFSGKAELDSSDWKNADWDVMLRETVKVCSEEVPGESYLEELHNWEKKIGSEAAGPSFLTDVAGDGGDLDALPKRVNAFLKRQAGETREAYTRRITHWLMGANLTDIKRNLGLAERARMARVLGLLAVQLAEYRLDHGRYPDTLEQLQPAAEADGFTGRPLSYRRVDEGFKLWSVGMNQADDGGAKDDIVIETGAEK